MRKAEEIYDHDYSSWYDYTPMLKEFGEILLRVDEKNYQGDSFVIYKDKDRYGYLNFGWGSCSGCDALMACNSLKEVQKLMDKLYNAIQWFPSLDALKEYFENKDWELCYQYHIPEFSEFLLKVQEL